MAECSCISCDGANEIEDADYDPRGILARLDDPEVGTFLFEADPLGRPVLRIGAGGATWTAGYTPDFVTTSVPGAPTETTTYGSHDERGHPGTHDVRGHDPAGWRSVGGARSGSCARERSAPP